MVGQLSWVSTQTRPNVAFDVCEFSQLYGRANVGDMIRVNKTVQRVKTNPVKVICPQLKNLKTCYLDRLSILIKFLGFTFFTFCIEFFYEKKNRQTNQSCLRIKK